MKKEKIVVIFICLLFLFSSLNINQVSAQTTTYQSFEKNPINYWTLGNDASATYHVNNTISLSGEPTPNNWLVNWDYRKPISITAGVGCGTNYQIYITINYNANMKADFSDIRFTKSDGITLLDCMRWTYTSSTISKWWVELLDTADSAQTIYMYYGNSVASLRSSGYNTFPIYDDFDDTTVNTSIWDHISGTIPSESGGYLRLTGVAGGGQLMSDNAVAIGFEYNISAYASATYTYSGRHFSMYDNDRSGSDYVNGYDTVTPNTWTIGTVNDGSSTNQNTLFSTQTSERVYSIKGISTSFKWYEVNTLKFTSSTNIPNENLQVWYTRASTGTATWYINYCVVRKLGSSEPTYSFGSQQTLSTHGTFIYPYVTIPLLLTKDVSIKTMVEIPELLGTEYVTFALDTIYGTIDDLTYTLNTTDRTRIEFVAKKQINIFRINIYDEFQSFISRTEISHVLSKEITALRMTLYNFTSSSKMIMFYMSGSVDYSIKTNWQFTEIDDHYGNWQPNISMPFQTQFDGYCEFSGYYDWSWNISFDNFQYIRTYVDMNYFYEYPEIADSSLTTYIWVNVSSYAFKLYIINIMGGESDMRQGYIDIFKNNIEVFDWTNFGDGGSNGSTFQDNLRNNFKIWRTLDNRLGLAFGSDNGIWRYDSDTRRSLEEFSYWYSDDIVNDYSGNMTIKHEAVYQCVGDDAIINYEESFTEMEYDFSSDFPIAEPHFSSTWYQLLPLGWLIDYLVGGFNAFTAGLGIPALNPDEFFDFWGGIAEAISSALSPVIEGIAITLSPIIESIASTLSPILENIFDAFGDLFTSIADAILTWAGDVADWFINTALMGFVNALADFFVWFINGIGSLLGVDGLATIIADTIVNFGIAILNFLNGIILLFAIGANFFGTVITLVTTYAPMLIYYGGMILLITTLFVIASMDEKKIVDLFSFYARVLEKLMGAFYWVANMVIQFIGGIIP